MAKNHTCVCGKQLSSYHSLWRHKKICKKNQEPTPTIQHDTIIGNILNKVVQRANMDVPKALPKKMFETVKPSDMEEKATSGSSDVEQESDTDMDMSDSEEKESSDVEFMPENPEDLKKQFRQLFNKLHENIGIYNKLVFMLDELKRMGCLTKEECNAMNKCLQEKMGV